MDTPVNASFIVRIKWVSGTPHITLQNLETRQRLEITSWSELFSLLQALSGSLSGEQLENV